MEQAKPTIGPMSYKKYKCRECGHETQHQTNHWGPTYSWGRVDVCPHCPPYKRPTTWDCMETPPDGFARAEEWKTAQVTIKKIGGTKS